jgi:hypothetical protein
MQTFGNPAYLALMSQAATMIYAQVSAIQNILGGRFDTENLLFTVNELESLTRRLETKRIDVNYDSRTS